VGLFALKFAAEEMRRQTQETFKQLADRWLRTEGRRLVCPDNERRHVWHLRALWELTEEALRPRAVKEALAGLAKANGGPLGASTLNKLRSTGTRIVRDAQENGEWLGLNPFQVVRRFREEECASRTLTLSECRKLLRQLPERRRTEVLFALVLGPRPGESKALRKVDVDLRRRCVTFRRSNARNTTKNGRARVLPVPSGLWPHLLEALDNPSPFVFPGTTGKRQRADAKLSKTLRAALARAGLVEGYRYLCRRHECGRRENRPRREEGARCPECGFLYWVVPRGIQMRYYDLRHTAATLHLRAGCSAHVVRRFVLGHVGNVSDGYWHLTEKDVRRELSKLRLP
jgi:integrase